MGNDAGVGPEWAGVAALAGASGGSAGEMMTSLLLYRYCLAL